MPRVVRTRDECLALLHNVAKPEQLLGMARFGIDTSHALGVRMPDIRAIGSSTVKDHALAQKLWECGFLETRILAGLVDHPKWVTREQCDAWAADFNSWDLVDQTTGNLFDKLPFADELIFDWAKREEEFVKRAAFSMIAWMAVHQKKRLDNEFLQFLPLIEVHADDNRNFVKKAVNWALRQIGKRSAQLHGPTLSVAERLSNSHNTAKQWVGKDAARELASPKIRDRLFSPRSSS